MPWRKARNTEALQRCATWAPLPVMAWGTPPLLLPVRWTAIWAPPCCAAGAWGAAAGGIVICPPPGGPVAGGCPCWPWSTAGIPICLPPGGPWVIDWPCWPWGPGRFIVGYSTAPCCSYHVVSGGGIDPLESLFMGGAPSGWNIEFWQASYSASLNAQRRGYWPSPYRFLSSLVKHTPLSPQRRHLSFLLVQGLGGEGDSHPCPGHCLGDPWGHPPPLSPRGELVKEASSPGSHRFCYRLRLSGVAFIYEVLCGNTFNCPCFGEALSISYFWLLTFSVSRFSRFCEKCGHRSLL